ncbi:zinc ribbon domain-containing protein [Streptomyces sp. NPDC050423]|uniref:zinc ribbon domain-containing protein n=1 Tax=Streptomyces sp. NPDC050423 TaxID=3155402 RepID=UPI0034188E3A
MPVIYIDPAYTSQECSQCHHTARANRPAQARFACKACGFVEHADHNSSWREAEYEAVDLVPARGGVVPGVGAHDQVQVMGHLEGADLHRGLALVGRQLQSMSESLDARMRDEIDDQVAEAFDAYLADRLAKPGPLRASLAGRRAGVDGPWSKISPTRRPQSARRVRPPDRVEPRAKT